MDSSRLNLPFTGITSFCKLPICADLETLDADVAIIGAPFDLGTQYRSGTRFGPRAIRNASAIYALREVGYYDLDFDTIFLDGVRMVDCGDIDMLHMRADVCLQNIEAAIRKILERGALPVTLGGDHAVPIPILRAFDSQEPVFVVQLDAHMDYVNERHGIREGHGNVMRRIHEMPHVAGIAQVGIRGPGSSGPEDFQDAKRNGSIIIGAREFKRIGVEHALAKIPNAPRYYVTMDVDSLDASLAPGSGSPSFGGFNYIEVTDFLRGIAKKGNVVGFDFVEVAPQYDPSEITAQLAARIILDFLGAIFDERKHKPHTEKVKE